MNDHLRQALRSPHDARRANCLVRRNEYEMFGAKARRKVHHVLGTKNIVEHCLAHVALHQWHVFVRRRVEDRVRPEILEDLCEANTVTHVSYDWLNREVREQAAQVPQQLEDGVLASSDDYELRRI